MELYDRFLTDVSVCHFDSSKLQSAIFSAIRSVHVGAKQPHTHILPISTAAKILVVPKIMA